MEEPLGVYPALAGPGQADCKAGPGETAWRGSNKPRPVCNGSDMPSVYSVARTAIERYIKVRGEAHPYQPEPVAYFEKRRCFAWRTYPVGKTRAFAAGKDKMAIQDASANESDCRITSAEADLRKA